MAAVFYNSSGNAIDTRYVEDVQQHQMGTTLDGDPIYHTTYVRNGKHISYDTVVVRGDHRYIWGSGHETSHGSRDISRWDVGNQITWREAQTMHTRDLARNI